MSQADAEKRVNFVGRSFRFGHVGETQRIFPSG
jgi:hypothetical protein